MAVCCWKALTGWRTFVGLGPSSSTPPPAMRARAPSPAPPVGAVLGLPALRLFLITLLLAGFGRTQVVKNVKLG